MPHKLFYAIIHIGGDILEIKLLSPKDTSVVEILPPLQNQILSELPVGDDIVECSFDWRAPSATESENSAPRYINFSWGLFGSLAGVISISLLISQDNDFSNYMEHPIMPGQAFMSINNFKRNTTYFWKVVAFGVSGVVCESDVATFKTSNALPQWYKLPGVTNFRDIGGWMTDSGVTIKEGLIFRGSQVGLRDENPDELLSFLQNNLKIKTQIDLRFDDEIRPFNKLIPNADYYRFSILPYDAISNDKEKEKILKIFKIFSNRDSYPVYLHCYAGADRTGTIAALIKFLLGVSADDIATDYELTSLCPFGMRCRSHEMYTAFLEYLLTLGNTYKEGAENYLLSCGVSKQEIQSIREILL